VIGRQRSEVTGERAEEGRQKTEDRGQRTEDSGGAVRTSVTLLGQDMGDTLLIMFTFFGLISSAWIERVLTPTNTRSGRARKRERMFFIFGGVFIRSVRLIVHD
jgi:hypothetical protein